MEAHGRTPNRRTLLRSGALIATASLGAAVTTAGAHAADATSTGTRGRRAAADYPPTHWIPASSSNYRVSDRPTSYPIELVVIHVTQETFQDAMKIFQDPAKQVSAHYMVASADGYIGQFVREKDVAWHAGNTDYNNRSIGIEHEGWVDQPEWFTDALYESSAALTAAVCDRFAIPKDRAHIIAHSEVPGSDHTDPGPLWDWDRYIDLVNGV
ncbi:N-acetylmuramoyl-L-alanine amidase [Streptomyces coffeae]|uniref:N-acetylmuramoyl-L-alanine amidase n=1 Tax=Streptomyces coffeae TaxID=621382 RepID=A0ABS1NNV0_9ACTN|nr:N-acetylmuramoyl-L-alanine amidase [Streptomyces coffeae]MBL1101411.1 N-acetylmuramoyl-L-alanine amidase [Streptomyces coffeae]